MKRSSCGQYSPAEAHRRSHRAVAASPSSDISMIDRLSTTAPGEFVGRQQEMLELKAALGSARSGLGKVVMLVGEPGIGKTRTAQELACYAISQGFEALWGRCHATQGAPPYWPWVQVVRSLIQARRAEEIRFQMGAGAADIGQIVAEVNQLLPELAPPPFIDPQQARFRFFDSTSAFLSRASQACPLVIVLDNIHWADQPSLMLLEFLAQELEGCRLLIVGTYRDTELTRRHPLTQTLGELSREPSFRRVQLKGLGEEEVGQFLLASSGITPSQALVEALHGQTEGNPLFLTEVVRLLVQEGRLNAESDGTEENWSVIIPVGVREVIGRRLDRLSDRCNEVLSMAAVIGREFDLSLLEQLMNDPATGLSPVLSGNQVLEALEEAMSARVIEEAAESISRYQFSHVLIQDVLALELSSARRARLHVRIADALEHLYGPTVQLHAAELVYHLKEASTATDRDKLVRYSMLAGNYSLATHAYEEAAAHFEQGLEVKRGQLCRMGPEMAADEDAAALLFGLARAQLPASDRFRMQTVREPAAILKSAFDYYAQAGDLAMAVAVAEHPVGMALGVVIGEAELISRALNLVAPDSLYAGRLLSTYGLSIYQETGDYQGAQESFAQSLAIARREQDLAVEIRTMANAADVEYFQMCWDRVLEKGQRVVELSNQVVDPDSLAVANFVMARVQDFRGNAEMAQYQATALLDQAERLRSRGFLSSALYISGVLALHRGDWTSARDLFDRGLRMVPDNPPILCARTVLEYLPGNLDLGRRYVEEALDATRSSRMGAGFA